MRVRYLHSDVDTLRRVELLTELRAGRLRRARRHQPAARGPRPARGVARRDPRRRQGGLPALVHVAHPDHRPRGPQRLAARCTCTPTTLTDSMKLAIDETDRRREKQVAYNIEHGIDPQPLRKKIADITDVLAREGADTARAARRPARRREARRPRRTSAARASARQRRQRARDDHRRPQRADARRPRAS